MPVRDFDQCTFYNFAAPFDGETFEEVYYMSTYIHNAIEFLNHPGIIPPVFEYNNVDIRIMMDDEKRYLEENAADLGLSDDDIEHLCFLPTTLYDQGAFFSTSALLASTMALVLAF